MREEHVGSGLVCLCWPSPSQKRLVNLSATDSSQVCRHELAALILTEGFVVVLATVTGFSQL